MSDWVHLEATTTDKALWNWILAEFEEPLPDLRQKGTEARFSEAMLNKKVGRMKTLRPRCMLQVPAKRRWAFL